MDEINIMREREKKQYPECLSALAEASTLLTASPPSARPSLQDCAQLPAFQNVLSKMEQFFRLIQTKEDEEKEEFFRLATRN